MEVSPELVGDATGRVWYMVTNCVTCRQFDHRQAREPMGTRQILDRSWQIAMLDIFYHESHSYLMTLDYCSDFSEIDLPRT